MQQENGNKWDDYMNNRLSPEERRQFEIRMSLLIDELFGKPDPPPDFYQKIRDKCNNKPSDPEAWKRYLFFEYTMGILSISIL